MHLIRIHVSVLFITRLRSSFSCFGMTQVSSYRIYITSYELGFWQVIHFLLSRGPTCWDIFFSEKCKSWGHELWDVCIKIYILEARLIKYHSASNMSTICNFRRTSIHQCNGYKTLQCPSLNIGITESIHLCSKLIINPSSTFKNTFTEPN